MTVIAPSAIIVPRRTSKREYFIDNSAEIKKVLSPNSENKTRIKAAVSPGRNPVDASDVAVNAEATTGEIGSREARGIASSGKHRRTSEGDVGGLEVHEGRDCDGRSGKGSRGLDRVRRVDLRQMEERREEAMGSGTA